MSDPNLAGIVVYTPVINGESIGTASSFTLDGFKVLLFDSPAPEARTYKDKLV